MNIINYLDDCNSIDELHSFMKYGSFDIKIGISGSRKYIHHTKKDDIFNDVRDSVSMNKIVKKLSDLTKDGVHTQVNAANIRYIIKKIRKLENRADKELKNSGILARTGEKIKITLKDMQTLKEKNVPIEKILEEVEKKTFQFESARSKFTSLSFLEVGNEPSTSLDALLLMSEPIKKSSKKKKQVSFDDNTKIRNYKIDEGNMLKKIKK